jgi:hypothetical protein
VKTGQEFMFLLENVVQSVFWECVPGADGLIGILGMRDIAPDKTEQFRSEYMCRDLLYSRFRTLVHLLAHFSFAS